MNKKISTRTGLIVGMLIVAFILLMKSSQIETTSPLVLIQFLILFLGIITSQFLLFKFYDAIELKDYFKHGFRTLATILVIIVLANTILFFVFKSSNESNTNLTIIIGYTIFAYTISGALSTLVSSFIFNIFTKK